MAFCLQRLVTAVLVVAVLGEMVKATAEDYTSKFDSNVQAILNDFNETVAIDSISIPQILLPGIIELKVDMQDISITGLKSIKGSQCTYDPDTTIATISLSEQSLEIYVAQLKMKGILFGNIDIDGTGDGWFWLENFVSSIEGPTEQFDFSGPEPIIKFTDVALTLNLERWTVDMRGLTPDSDLTQMMNSVFTMVGPEIFRGLGESITNSLWFKPLVNRIFADPATEETTTQEQTDIIVNNRGAPAEQDKMIEHANAVKIIAHAGLAPQETKLEHQQLRHPRLLMSLGRQ